MKSLLIISFLSLSLIAESQCCPNINNIEIIPAIPTTTDIIKVVTSVTTPNQGGFINSAHAVNGNTIDVEACYFNGIFTAPQTYSDTLTIGMLNEGNYDIDFIAYQSSDTICNYSDSTESSLNFTVLENITGIESLISEIGQVYPNPSTGAFTIELPTELKATHIRIIAISGEVVYHGEYTDNVYVNIESGMYLIQIIRNKTVIGYQRLSKR